MKMNQFLLDDFLLDLTYQHLPPFSQLAASYPLHLLPNWLEDLTTGRFLNISEQRPIMHLALRARHDDNFSIKNQSVMPQVMAVREQMAQFCKAMQAGQIVGVTGHIITDIVHLGIGGSGLGVRLVLEALAPLATQRVKVHVINGIDSAELEDVLFALNPHSTLILVASKSMSTKETLMNFEAALCWFSQNLPVSRAKIIENHCIALTANIQAAEQLGFKAAYIFPFWDWVGGRFSIWSSVGLAIALSLGMPHYEALLSGARAMDQHFLTAQPEHNMPVNMALAHVWQVHQHNVQAVSIVSYSYRMRNFTSFLQQLIMESNGKNRDIDGRPLCYKTAPIVFGGVGSDVQHSYFQLLHQGTWNIASDFIVIGQTTPHFKGHSEFLISSCIAQIVALSEGNPEELNPHKKVAGQHPSTLIILPQLTPYYLGMLIALYEHAVYIQGRILNINSFDQWGVELGKTITQHIEPLLFKHSNSGLNIPYQTLNDSTFLWLRKLQALLNRQ